MTEQQIEKHTKKVLKYIDENLYSSDDRKGTLSVRLYQMNKMLDAMIGLLLMKKQHTFKRRQR